MTAVRVYQQRLAAIRKSTATAVIAQWDQLPEYNKPVTEGFARRVVPIVAAGQLLAARTTSAHVARQTGLVMPRMTKANVTGQAARPVDPMEEYQRPFGHMWSEIGKGALYGDSIKAGRNYLGLLAVTDVLLATRAASAVIDWVVSEITSWVRVADAGACDVCDAIDGAVYAQAEDFEVHPNCGCTTDPQTDPTAADATPEPDSVTVTQHGELGAYVAAATDVAA